jgi:hypothetical protein
MEKNMKDQSGMKDQKDQKTTGSSYTPSSKSTGNNRNENLRDKEPIAERGNKASGDKGVESSRDKADTTGRK